MNGGVSTSWTRQPRLKLSNITFSHSSRKQSPVERALAQDTSSYKKRQRDETSESYSLRKKRPKCSSAPSLEPKAERSDQLSPAAPLQKRQIRSDGDDSEHRLERVELTRKNLALFNKMAKKKGTNKASISVHPTSAVESPSTKTTSTTMSGFAIQAKKNGILDTLKSKPPENLEEIRERFARSRATASPSESAYRTYVGTVGRAANGARHERDR